MHAMQRNMNYARSQLNYERKAIVIRNAVEVTLKKARNADELSTQCSLITPLLLPLIIIRMKFMMDKKILDLNQNHLFCCSMRTWNIHKWKTSYHILLDGLIDYFLGASLLLIIIINVNRFVVISVSFLVVNHLYMDTKCTLMRNTSLVVPRKS